MTKTHMSHFPPMKTHIPIFRWLSIIGAGLAIAASSAFGQNNASTDRYLVKVTPGNDPRQVATGHGLEARHVYTRVFNGFAAQVPPGRLAVLANDPRVAHISVDHQ